MVDLLFAIPMIHSTQRCTYCYTTRWEYCWDQREEKRDEEIGRERNRKCERDWDRECEFDWEWESTSERVERVRPVKQMRSQSSQQPSIHSFLLSCKMDIFVPRLCLFKPARAGRDSLLGITKSPKKLKPTLTQLNLTRVSGAPLSIP